MRCCGPRAGLIGSRDRTPGRGGVDPRWRRLTLRVYRWRQALDVEPERKWLIRSRFAAEARNLLVQAWVPGQVQRFDCPRAARGGSDEQTSSWPAGARCFDKRVRDRSGQRAGAGARHTRTARCRDCRCDRGSSVPSEVGEADASAPERRACDSCRSPAAVCKRGMLKRHVFRSSCARVINGALIPR